MHNAMIYGTIVVGFLMLIMHLPEYLRRQFSTLPEIPTKDGVMNTDYVNSAAGA